MHGQIKQLGSICVKHCIALFYLDIRFRPIFRIHFPNVVALAEKDRSKRKPCARCLSALISAGIKHHSYLSQNALSSNFPMLYVSIPKL